MKKLALTITFLFGMTIGAFAEWNTYDSGWNLFHLFNSHEDEQEEANVGLFEDTEINVMMWNNVIEAPTNMINYEGGGLFGRGRSMNTGVGFGFRNNFGLLMPGQHGQSTDEFATPIGSGVIVLLGMGGAYLVAKKRKRS